MFRILAFLLSIQLFASTALTAQTRTHKFDLKAAPESLNPSIAYIRVIDSRLNKENFGYIMDLSAREQKLITDVRYLQLWRASSTSILSAQHIAVQIHSCSSSATCM